MIKLKCSPRPDKSQRHDFTCFDDKTIYKLRDLWNMRHKDSPIQSMDPKEIWTQLQKNMSHLCNKESCWLNQQFTNGELEKSLETYFAPKSPEEWKKNQRSNQRKRLGRYLDRRDVDLHLLHWDQIILRG